MPKRYLASVLHALVMILLLGVSCAASPAILPNAPAQQPEVFDSQSDTISWNGLNLVRDTFGNNSCSIVDIVMQENVLTEKDHLLTVSITNRGSDELLYGTYECTQINLDGLWYTMSGQLSHRESPLKLPPVNGKTAEFTTDFSVLGNLPVGRYRLVEKFFNERLQREYCAFAYYWIIEPGAERPPESETTEPAHMDDIIFVVESISAARREITDQDERISFYIENISGKLYHATGCMLEIKQGDQWTALAFRHANLGLVLGWTTTRNDFFPNEPLVAGNYRVKLFMEIFGTNNTLEPFYEFTVLSHKDAPMPKWEKLRLTPSALGNTGNDTGVTITLKNSVLNEKTQLEYTVTAEGYYMFGVACSIEVFLDGTWYKVPTYGIFTTQAIFIGPGADASEAFFVDPVFMAGILPEGKYRLVKEFYLVDIESRGSTPTVFLAREYATAEFTVVETLELYK